MLLVTELLFLALIVAIWAPDTTFGKSLRALLIDAPVRALNHTTPMKVIVGLVVSLGLLAVVIGAPEIVALIGLSDLSFCFDVAVVVMLTSAVTRLKSGFNQIIRPGYAIAARVVARFNQSRGRNRFPRPRRLRRPPSTDEIEPRWSWAFA